ELVFLFVTYSLIRVIPTGVPKARSEGTFCFSQPESGDTAAPPTTAQSSYYRGSVSSSSQPAVSDVSRFSLHQFFGPGGLLSRTHPAYEFRRGQLSMAQAVEQALSEKRHLVVEAGTGTGKTLAYLMPVIRSG